jgi:nucleoside-diphosphate-sugar epimerase
VSEEKPNYVICAQWDGVEKRHRNNLEKQYSNVDAQLLIANKAVEENVSGFIAFGSQAEFTPSTSKIPELESCNPESHYGRSKTILLERLKPIFAESNTRFIWARVFSIYGPLDPSDSLVNGVVSAIISGENYDIENPEKLWSFLYEADFAAAIDVILSQESINGIVNVANPDLVRLAEVASFARIPCNLSKSNADSHTDIGFKPETLKLQYAGWAAKFNLEEGLTATLQHHQIS